MNNLNERIMSLRGFSFDGKYWEKDGIRMPRIPDYTQNRSKALKLVDMLRSQFGNVSFDIFPDAENSWSCKLNYEKRGMNGKNIVVNSEVYEQPSYEVAICKAWISFMHYVRNNGI